MHETHRLSWDGAVDADGHILEPSDLWETYLEPQYRDRALRVVKDENGLDELEIGGQRSTMSRRGFPSTLAAMGRTDLVEMAKDPSVTYDNHAAYGSRDAKERLKLLDAEHIDAAVIYTTTGLLWEAELEDAELSQAYCRAYNRWICDWCSDGGGRLIPTAHLSLMDPAGAPPRRWSGPSATAPAAASWRRGCTPPSRSAIRTTTPCSPPRRTSTSPSPSTPCSSRSGPRAPAWAHGRTCATSGSPPPWPAPTACATSSRRCSTTACSTASPA